MVVQKRLRGAPAACLAALCLLAALTTLPSAAASEEVAVSSRQRKTSSIFASDSQPDSVLPEDSSATKETSDAADKAAELTDEELSPTARNNGNGAADSVMSSLKTLISLLPFENPPQASVVDEKKDTQKQGLDGFTLSDLMPNGLRALEGLDDMLRSTVPRLDRFNCIERIMCEIAAPFEDDTAFRESELHDGVQTLQQLHEVPVHHQYPHLAHQPFQQHHFIRPHHQQFQQHQQHQQRLIQQHLLQQQQQQQQQFHDVNRQHSQQSSQPFPFYIPDSADAGNQEFREQEAYIVPRAPQSGEKQVNDYANNNIRRDEPHYSQFHHQQQQQQVQQGHEAPNRPQYNYQHQQQQHQQQQHQQQQHKQHGVNYQQQGNNHQQYYPQQQNYAPYEYQQAAQQQPQYAVAPPRSSFAAPPTRRRRPTFRRFINHMFGGSRRRSHNGRRRGRRDTETETLQQEPVPEVRPQKRSRQTKIAPIFKADEEVARLEASSDVEGRRSKIAPGFEPANAVTKEQSKVSPIKTLTKSDLEAIKARIEAINNEVLANSTSEGGRQTSRGHSRRQGRLLNTLLNGWSGKKLLGLLDSMMDGYSFHPYTHAAYKGYTSRAGSCADHYPRCPDNTEDILNFFNNFHRHYPDGLPFKDSLPWPFNKLF